MLEILKKQASRQAGLPLLSGKVAGIQGGRWGREDPLRLGQHLVAVGAFASVCAHVALDSRVLPLVAVSTLSPGVKPA